VRNILSVCAEGLGSVLFESRDDRCSKIAAAMVRFLSEISAYQLRRHKGICQLVNLIDCSYRNDVRRVENTRDSYLLALIGSEATCIRQPVSADASFFHEGK
jgi:hypothetical protein